MMVKHSIAVSFGVLVGAQLALGAPATAPRRDPLKVLCEYNADTLNSKPLPCAADPQSCRSWRAFRRSHPYPFQSLVVDMVGADEAVVIVSEPPPVASPEDVTAFATAVFGDDAARARLRVSIGQDGWLDDLVFHVKGLQGPSVRFPSGDGTTTQLPEGLAERLQYLSQHLFDAEDLAYVDRTSPSTVSPELVDDLHFSAADLQGVTEDRIRSWSELPAGGAFHVQFDTMEQSRTPGAWIDDRAELVAFVVPKQVDVQRTRAAFRRFAMFSDELVGALGPTSGGMVLFGRRRRIPLEVLPPLRFETLATLATTLGQPLAQSYERNRSYAGKILLGPFMGWDWAPAYLSAQLEDTEFGMLLNVADQQLKSWSEHGNIRYANFSYPSPKSFPFGDAALSSRASKAESIIYNWNTEGYGSEADNHNGRLFSVTDSTALPVSYIMSSGASEALGASPEASSMGSRYFAGIGDPVLSRVARNVVLYQALSAIKPFAQPKNGGPAVTKRSAAVSAVLVRETTSWVNARLATRDKSDPVVALVRSSGLSPALFAKLMASPEDSTQGVIALASADSKNRDLIKKAARDAQQTVDELKANNAAGRAEFISRCITTPIETPLGLSCEASPYVSKGPAELKQERLQAKLSRLKSDVSGYEQKLDEVDKRLHEIAAQRRAAAHAVELLQEDEYPRLGAVFDEVRNAGGGAPSTSFIQTPSIVLSCNSEKGFSVGGHNIDPLPEQPLQSASRPTIAGSPVPAAQQIPAPARSSAVALAVESRPPAHGSFLSLMKDRAPALEPSFAEAVRARAALCNCDVYVERGESGVSTIVEMRPPPKTTRVFGSGKLVEKLAERKGSERVLFAGYEPHSVSGLTRAAAMRAEKSLAGIRPEKPLAASIPEARRLFEVPEASAQTTLRVSANGGKQFSVGADSLSELSRSLVQRPSWRTASISTPSGTAGHLVEVQVGADASATSLKVYAYDAKGELVVSPRLSTIATTEFRAVHDASIKDAVNRVGNRLTRESSVQEVDFFLKNVGKQGRLQKSPGSDKRIASGG